MKASRFRLLQQLFLLLIQLFSLQLLLISTNNLLQFRLIVTLNSLNLALQQLYLILFHLIYEFVIIIKSLCIQLPRQMVESRVSSFLKIYIWLTISYLLRFNYFDELWNLFFCISHNRAKKSTTMKLYPFEEIFFFFIY